MHATRLIPAALALIVLTGTPADAQWRSRDPWDRGPVYGRRAPVFDIASSNGFEEGYRKGRDDGRDRDRFDVRRHGRYRSADQGYRREYGPKDIYRQAYRAGFERGYEAGYRDGRRDRGGRWRW